MKKITRIKAVQQFCRHAPRPLVLVPTMGGLHEGHEALLRRARRAVGSKGTVVAYIFVNPKQFGPKEDLSKYPRPLSADLALCEREGVDMVFHPQEEEIYTADDSITIEEKQLSQGLCARSRPGHFSGVLIVLAKFFNILTPDSVVFGEKDWQQLALVRRLVRDLNYPIKVIGCPTVREKDGLAMSSRNAYLIPKKHAAASVYKTLKETAQCVKAGETSVAKLLARTRRALTAIPNSSVDYVEIVDEVTLQPITKIPTSKTKARLLVAVKFGRARLIDNIGLTCSK